MCRRSSSGGLNCFLQDDPACLQKCKHRRSGIPYNPGCPTFFLPAPPPHWAIDPLPPPTGPSTHSRLPTGPSTHSPPPSHWASPGGRSPVRPTCPPLTLLSETLSSPLPHTCSSLSNWARTSLKSSATCKRSGTGVNTKCGSAGGGRGEASGLSVTGDVGVDVGSYLGHACKPDPPVDGNGAGGQLHRDGAAKQEQRVGGDLQGRRGVLFRV